MNYNGGGGGGYVFMSPPISKANLRPWYYLLTTFWA